MHFETHSNKPQLEYLNCYNNSISIIDVSGCNALKKLYCAENPINSYDVSKLPNRLFTLALGATWSVSYDDVSCSNDDLVLSFPSKITLYNGPTVIYPIEDEDYDY